ncbi:leucine-rich repeat-containing protein [Tanacetum coccineum]
MRENIYFYFMHIHVLSLVLLWFNTTTATSHENQLVAAAGQAVHKCIEKERQALLDFKAPLHDPYDMLSTWRPEEEDDCCEWFGVTCNNQTGHVTKLDLFGAPYSSSLEGEITLSLLNLTYLSHLELNENSFNGTIPKFICSMTHLTFLSLYNNKFTGTIPKSIGNMTQLTHLDLSDNFFYGTIPREFGNLTNLEYLYLDSLESCRVENLDWLSSLSSLEDTLKWMELLWRKQTTG